MNYGDIAIIRPVTRKDVVEHSLRRRDEGNLRLPSILKLLSTRDVYGHVADTAEHSWDSIALFDKSYVRLSSGAVRPRVSLWHFDVHGGTPLGAHRAPVAAAVLLLDSIFRSDSNIRQVDLTDQHPDAQALWSGLDSHSLEPRGDARTLSPKNLGQIVASIETTLSVPNYRFHLTDQRTK
mgnify:CR=1 FL=1